MSIAENIKKLRSIFGITQKELARVAGVTENAVSKWENGYSEPRMGAIERMAACYGLSKMHIIEDDGMSLVDPITKRPIPQRVPGAIDPPPSRPAFAPLLGRVHAGEAQEPDMLDGEVSLPAEVAERHPEAYFLEVEGGCMDRVYPEGCRILVDPSRLPSNGSVAVVSIDGEDYVMRRLYRGADTLVLSPDSFDADFRDIVLREGDGHDVEFAGSVVWFQPSRELE